MFANFFLFSIQFPTLSLFFKSIICLSHFVFIPLLTLSSPLTHVRIVITFGGSGEGKKGSAVGGKRGWESLKWTWGKGRKKHLYVYPITTPASPKSPSQRTDAHALKIATSIPPPPCVYVCWLQWWWGRLNNSTAFLSSVSSGFITCVSFLCVIVALCLNECVWVSECVSCVWLH